MYHLLSVSSAMLISFLIGLLFAAMCAIVGRLPVITSLRGLDKDD